MEPSSGPKELAATAGPATARRSSNPPAHEGRSRGFGFVEPVTGGDAAPNGNGKWTKCWRDGKGGVDAEGTPLGSRASDAPRERRAAPATIHLLSSEIERTIALIPDKVRHRMEVALEKNGQKFDPTEIKPCPFTDGEISELGLERDAQDPSKPREMLVFLPKNLSPAELHGMWGLQSNINFDVDRLVGTTMKNLDQWFIIATCSVPEMIDAVCRDIVAEYAHHTNGEQVVHGMDIRRYIAFLGYHLDLFGELPDRQYWNFLWGAPYDRSGILISGIDKYGVINSHGWMRNWRAKFAGSRCIVLPPREEINAATEHIQRVNYDPQKNRLMRQMRKHIEDLMQEKARIDALGGAVDNTPVHEDPEESGSVE